MVYILVNTCTYIFHTFPHMYSKLERAKLDPPLLLTGSFCLPDSMVADACLRSDQILLISACATCHKDAQSRRHLAGGMNVPYCTLGAVRAEYQSKYNCMVFRHRTPPLALARSR